jgi:hypothetical protein
LQLVLPIILLDIIGQKWYDLLFTRFCYVSL